MWENSRVNEQSSWSKTPWPRRTKKTSKTVWENRNFLKLSKLDWIFRLSKLSAIPRGTFQARNLYSTGHRWTLTNSLMSIPCFFDKYRSPKSNFWFFFENFEFSVTSLFFPLKWISQFFQPFYGFWTVNTVFWRRLGRSVKICH